jgi:cell division protein FtsL
VHAPARTRTTRRPAPARRRSGPAARTVALPRYDFVALLDRVLRGPAYIAVVGLLLAGIVFFNVDVLELNHGIARTDVRSSQLKRENAALTLKLAKLGSSERIQRVALQNGLVLPQPGDVRYLRADRQDAERALRVMTAPDSSSAAPVTPALLSQQSTPTPQSASTTPSSTVTPAQTGTTTAPTTTTAAPTTTTTTTTPATQTTPSTTAPASTTTPAGATAAPATTAQTTP